MPATRAYCSEWGTYKKGNWTVNFKFLLLLKKKKKKIVTLSPPHQCPTATQCCCQHPQQQGEQCGTPPGDRQPRYQAGCKAHVSRAHSRKLTGFLQKHRGAGEGPKVTESTSNT